MPPSPYKKEPSLQDKFDAGLSALGDEKSILVVTNDKATSTNKVADYANPARFYKGSSLTIKCTLGNITKIEVTCGSNEYATALVNSVGADAQANEKVVTISLAEHEEESEDTTEETNEE